MVSLGHVVVFVLCIISVSLVCLDYFANDANVKASPKDQLHEPSSFKQNSSYGLF